jgi:hypothetical protein
MNRKHILAFPWIISTLIGLLTLCGTGCSGKFNNAPVDAPKARETLRAALESWKKGDKVDALQGGSPPIYVIDPEWQAGTELKEFEVLGEGEEKDAHLFCSVKLTASGAGGQEVTRNVTYVISTKPNLTVSRKLF